MLIHTGPELSVPRMHPAPCMQGSHPKHSPAPLLQRDLVSLCAGKIIQRMEGRAPHVLEKVRVGRHKVGVDTALKGGMK